MLKVALSELIGKTMVSVVKSDNNIVFTATGGEVFSLHHEQDCCESVTVEDICGDLEDLVGSPIASAYEESNDGEAKYKWTESFTWTFYRISSGKGSVTIRFYGESNGYYSESVDLWRIK